MLMGFDFGLGPSFEVVVAGDPKAKDTMFFYTDTKQAPWYVINADVKKRARLNCINHLLQLIPYEDLTPPPIDLPPRQDAGDYSPPDLRELSFVPAVYPRKKD